MAADTTRRTYKFGQTVHPQPLPDSTVLESVADFVNEVTASTTHGHHGPDHKEVVCWARFEYADPNDLTYWPAEWEDNGNHPPLLLILGYSSGVQVWWVPVSGEAQEVLSWRQGAVRTLRLLPTPESFFGTLDAFSNQRPLMAICDSTGAGPQFCSISMISLRSGEQVKSIKFKTPVCDMLFNKRVVVVTFSEKIAVFDACTFEDRFTVSGCYPCPGPVANPVALGTLWLAFADRRLVSPLLSGGGVNTDGVHSYTATVLHAAKTITKGIKELTGSVTSSLTGVRPSQPPASSPTNTCHPGIVTILDINRVGKGDIVVQQEQEGVLAHFQAHMGQPIIHMAFDPTATLLLTADKQGHQFHLFRILPHPNGSSLSAVHHLYILYRGDTTAKVQDACFSLDSRWVAVSTHRGTTHVFPITPYGGSVSVRTHTSHRMVNKLSRFHRSAGLDDGNPTVGRSSPVLSSSPGSGGGIEFAPSVPIPYPNPRLPPYPHPTTISPLAQLRQPLLQTLASSTNTATRGNKSSPDDSLSTKVVSAFAPPRSWLVSSLPLGQEKGVQSGKKHPLDALFVMASHGGLIEYCLTPVPSSSVSKEKVHEDSPIELQVSAKAQWNLCRPLGSVEVHPPLAVNNPLLQSPQVPRRDSSASDQSDDESWLSQVEIVTHAAPNRRLWMGPQFSFKTYQHSSDARTDMCDSPKTVDLPLHSSRSNPMNMPSGETRPHVLIEGGGSGSSLERSPQLVEVYGERCESLSESGSLSELAEDQLKENLADAMQDMQINRSSGASEVILGDDSLSGSSSLSLSSHHSFPRASPTHSIDHVLVFPTDPHPPGSI